MTFTYLPVKVVAAAVFTISGILLFPLLARTEGHEQPVLTVATTTPPVASSVASSTPLKPTPVHKKYYPPPSRSGDCTAYADLIGQYNWPITIAMQICRDESQGDPNNVGDTNTAYVSCGLMQIRTLPGRPSCSKLKDPNFNIAYAYSLWLEEGFYPWSTYHRTLSEK